VVRDVSDINHPYTVNTFQNLDNPLFVSASEITSLSNPDENGLLRGPVAGSPGTVVANGCRGMIAFGWNPDGTVAAYVTDLSDSPSSELHIIANGQNRTVATMPPVPWGVDCGWPCEDRVDSRMAFSPDGSEIALVDSWGGPVLRIWTKDGAVLASVDAKQVTPQAAPTMSAWSGKSLYFRDSNGVERWSQGVQSLALPGVAWIRPKASPAGGSIVYEVRDSSGIPNVFFLNTSTGQIRELARSRSEPAFLTSRYVWWKGERPCGSGDSYPCGAGSPWSVATGKTYIYDLQTGAEFESVITTVWDVWPHPA
jgi:hypothetical protein